MRTFSITLAALLVMLASSAADAAVRVQMGPVRVAVGTPAGYLVHHRYPAYVAHHAYATRRGYIAHHTYVAHPPIVTAIPVIITGPSVYTSVHARRAAAAEIIRARRRAYWHTVDAVFP